MSDNNKCFFVGNLTRDVETRDVGQHKVSKFGLAVETQYKKNGETIKGVNFLDFEIWNCDKVMDGKKGQQIQVNDAEAKVDSWEDKTTGGKRSKVIFKVWDLEIAGESKKEVEKPKRGRPAAKPVESKVAEETERPDDDIPF